MSDPKQNKKQKPRNWKEQKPRTLEEVDEYLNETSSLRKIFTPEEQKKVTDAVLPILGFIDKYLPTPGKTIDGVITLGKVGSEGGRLALEGALYPFKLFDNLFHVSDGASKLKNLVCGCSNATEPQSTHSTPTAKPAPKGRE